MPGARLAEVDFAVNAVLDRLDAVEVEDLVARSLAHNELLLRFDELLANLANWRIYVVLAPVVDSEPQVALALLCATVALGERRFECIELVIKSKFFVLLDVAPRKNANGCLFTDRPLPCFAVRIARVVDEASDIAEDGRVDDLTVLSSHHVRARRHFVLFYALLANGRVLVEHLAHVLHDEGALGEKFAGGQTPAFLLRLDRVDVRILMQLKPTIAARVAHWANFFCAILGHRPVETLLTAVVALLLVFEDLVAAALAIPTQLRGQRSRPWLAGAAELHEVFRLQDEFVSLEEAVLFDWNEFAHGVRQHAPSLRMLDQVRLALITYKAIHVSGAGTRISCKVSTYLLELFLLVPLVRIHIRFLI